MTHEVRSDTAARCNEEATTAPGGPLEARQTHVDADDSLNGLTSLLRQVLSDLNHAVDRNLASRALTFAKSIPLLALLDGQRHTASSIARDVRYDAGAMTRIISDLEDKGLITRERSRADRRVVYLQLTAPGREVARGVPPVLHEVMEANLACLARPERQLLTGLLRRVCAGAGAGADAGADSGNSVSGKEQRGCVTRNGEPQS